MVEKLQQLCELFIANRDAISEEFRWGNQYIIPVCANIFTQKGAVVSKERLKQCRQLLRDNTSVFSDFRSFAELPVITLLATSADPAKRLSDTLAIFDIVKKYFRGGNFSVLVSAILAEMCTTENAEGYISRGKHIYEMMKQAHPFLTDSEDSVMAVLLAFSTKDDRTLHNDMEACYALLRKITGDSNTAQAVSHVLCMYDGAPEEKCARLQALYDMLTKARRKYSKYHEMNVLAYLAINAPDLNEAVAQIAHADNFLDGQRGYTGLGLDKKTRTMHAAMITSDLYNISEANTTAIAGTLAMIAVQYTAMLCSVAALNTINAAT